MFRPPPNTATVFPLLCQSRSVRKRVNAESKSAYYNEIVCKLPDKMLGNPSAVRSVFSRADNGKSRSFFQQRRVAATEQGQRRVGHFSEKIGIIPVKICYGFDSEGSQLSVDVFKKFFRKHEFYLGKKAFVKQSHDFIPERVGTLPKQLGFFVAFFD